MLGLKATNNIVQRSFLPLWPQAQLCDVLGGWEGGWGGWSGWVGGWVRGAGATRANGEERTPDGQHAGGESRRTLLLSARPV